MKNTLLLLNVFALSFSAMAADLIEAKTIPKCFPLQRSQEEGGVIAWGSPDCQDKFNPPEGLRAVQVATCDDTWTGADEYNSGLHSLALQKDGTVRAWGTNERGQINVPAGLKNVVQVAAGRGVSLALINDGTVIKWGSGKLYDSIPEDLAGVVKMAFSQEGTLFLLADGKCRFVPKSGEGRGKPLEGNKIDGVVYKIPKGMQPNSEYFPKIRLESFTDIVDITGGRNPHLLLSDGKAVNAATSKWAKDSIVPSDVINVAALAVSDHMAGHCVALLKDGSIRAWGRNDAGQCDIPPEASPAIKVSTGHDNACAIKQDGSLVIWGWHGRDGYAVKIPETMKKAKFIDAVIDQKKYVIAIVK